MTLLKLKNYPTQAVIDDEDYARASQYSWKINLDKQGNPRYVSTTGRIAKKLHRFLLNLPPWIPGTPVVDHRNRDVLDNRKSNLRVCPQGDNSKNVRKRKGANTSMYKGVTRDRNKWRARIRHANRLYDLGRFTDEIQAAIAYDSAAMKMFGEFACPNFLN